MLKCKKLTHLPLYVFAPIFAPYTILPSPSSLLPILFVYIIFLIVFYYKIKVWSCIKVVIITSKELINSILV